MIMKDFRYIIKKILIGIGIIIGVSMIKSCNVYALDYNDMDLIYSLHNQSNTIVKNIYYDDDNYRFYIINPGHVVYGNYAQIVEQRPYYLITNGGPESSFKITFCSAPFKIIEEQNNTITTVNDTDTVINCRLFFLPNYNYEDWTDLSYFDYQPNSTNYNQYGISSMSNYSSNFDLKDANTGEVLYPANTDYGYPVEIEPYIVSLHPQLNKTEDNMLVSVSFNVEFSYIDTENYDYYAWFEGYDKVKLTQNNTQFNIQNNTTFNVEIRDKQDNLIDSKEYFVSSIGLVYNGDFDIQFKNEEYSESDTVNDSDAVFDIINRVDIDVLYIPKWINYKYLYQFVPENQTVSNDWILVNNNNDKNNFVYTATSNGTLYAKILDSDNNYLYSATYTITRIGALKTYDKNTDSFYTMFNIIKDKLNFGGPISDLIVIPVNVLQSISNASNKVCTPYNLGSIGGHYIVLPCIEPEDYLGSALWTTIDLIFSGCIFFAISKWFTSAYYNFILLDNTPGIKERRDLK